jgi:hypothetical protein
MVADRTRSCHGTGNRSGSCVTRGRREASTKPYRRGPVGAKELGATSKLKTNEHDLSLTSAAATAPRCMPLPPAEPPHPDLADIRPQIDRAIGESDQQRSTTTRSSAPTADP